jgi:hypothetical protein
MELKTAPMKNVTPPLLRILLSVAILAAASCASAPPTPQMRQAYLRELADAYDIEGTIGREQTESLAEAQHALASAKIQFADVMSRLPPERRDKLDAAADRFVTAARGQWDVNQAAAVWTQAYAANLSDEDLQKIVEFSRTPAGQAQIAAERDAGNQLRAYLAQQRHATMDRALQQYMTELKAIADPAPH